MKQTQFEDTQYVEMQTPNICAVCHAPSVGKFVVGETKFAKLPISIFTTYGKTKKMVEVKLCLACSNKLEKPRRKKSAAKSYNAQVKAGQMELFNAN